MHRINRRQIIAAGTGLTAASAAFAAGADDAPPAGRVFDVRAFGATGGGADDTPGVQAALRALLQAGGGTLHVPAGAYRVSERLDVRLPRGTGFALRGDGPGLSKLIWGDADGGLLIRFTPEGGFDGPDKAAVSVSGLTLLTAHAGGSDDSPAVQLVNDGGTSPAPKKLLRDLVLAGTTPAAGWSRGVDAVDCTFLTIDGIDYQGPGQSSGVAVRFSGNGDPVDNYVTRLRVFGARAGVEVGGTSEGVYLTQSTMLAVEVGVDWHTPRGEPLLAMSGCHVAASRACVRGHNLIQPIITGNLFYQSGDAEWAGVRLSADEPSIYDLLQVSHNTIHGFAGAGRPRDGIVVEGRSGGVIQGNVIQNVRNGIWLRAGTSGMRVLDNYVQRADGADVRDDGKDNVVRRV